MDRTKLKTEKPTEIKQEGRSQSDYMALKQQEWYSQLSQEKSEYKFYDISKQKSTL
jgi:hypothetical protein